MFFYIASIFTGAYKNDMYTFVGHLLIAAAWEVDTIQANIGWYHAETTSTSCFN